MSYLNAPRLTFFGQFLADPSTLNNDPCNYVTDNQSLDPSWNPNGSHAFKITNCTITGLTMPDGSPGTGDPLLGTALTSIDSPNPAKLVDLDTEQQSVSMIFGMTLQGGSPTSGSFTGSFAPVCFNDIFPRVSGIQSDSAFSAYYQSILTDVQWSNPAASPFLTALEAASSNGLSIKFVVDGFQADSSSPDFTLGRVVGTIGPAAVNEPPNFVVGRFLRPNTNAAVTFNFGWACVDATAGTVTVDLGNSLMATQPAGPPPDLGTLTAVVLPKGTPFIPTDLSKAVTLGTIDYSLTAYQNAAWVQSFTADSNTIAQLQDGAELAIVQLSQGTTTVVLQENVTCGYVCATPFVFRLNPGDTADVTLMAVQNGTPAAGQTIALAANNSGLQPANCKGINLNVGVPAEALTYPASVITGPDGTATVQLTASDPGHPRSSQSVATYLNGQIYGVGFVSQALDPAPDGNWFLSVHIYGSTPIPADPTWTYDVLPILQPFARLYPFMDRMIKLNDYAAIKAAAPQIAQTLQLPIDSPHHMPVTRDMSEDQRKIVLNWIANGTPQ